MNPRVQIMIQSRELEEAAAPDREVIVRWRKAIITYHDAAKNLSSDSKLALYYQAGLQAATALIRAAGSGCSGRTTTVTRSRALRALNLGDLSAIAREMNAFRRSRHQSIYDWDDSAPGDAADEAANLEALARGVDRRMILGRAWLVASRPSAASEFDPPTP
jgi:hypothetical protein